jgi:hypothetical protein
MVQWPHWWCCWWVESALPWDSLWGEEVPKPPRRISPLLIAVVVGTVGANSRSDSPEDDIPGMDRWR